MTAEGDNSVLMQKVAKERLTALQKAGGATKPNKPAQNCTVGNPEYLQYLIGLKEYALFTKLGEVMAAAGKKDVYNTWMLQESDLIQAAAKAYGESLIAER